MTSVRIGDCFGWVHQGSGSDRGAILCAATGYEALGTHQSWRVLADRLAAAGLPTLRFDYPGYGDSLDAPRGTNAIEASIESIRQAAEFLRQQAGVSEVALIGLRLGAALAIEAALQGEDVDHLVLVTPVVRGKSFLLEQKAMAKVIAARGGPGAVEELSSDCIAIEGFTLDRDAIDKIAEIDLRSIERPPARRVLIASEPGARSYDVFARRLETLACSVAKVELFEVPAWRPSTIPAPPPLADIKSIVAWVRQGASARPARAVAAEGLETEAFMESTLSFGDSDRLSGVLCRPKTTIHARRRQALIFLNTGANHHIGSGGAAVEHARFLATQGYASLRMDCLGIGNSGWLADGPLAAIHHDERGADVSQAIDALAKLGFQEICVAGICSGAFLAFRAALRDARIGRLLLVNPVFWFPLSTEQLADPRQGTFGATAVYVSKALSRVAWRRVFNGEVSLGVLSSIAREIAARRLNAIFVKYSRYLARLSKYADARSKLERAFLGLGERNCKTLLVFSLGDPALEIFAEHLGTADAVAPINGLQIEVIRNADHVFATAGAREIFRRLLTKVINTSKRKSPTAPLGTALTAENPTIRPCKNA